MPSCRLTSRVRRFVLLHKEFDADESEMTRSRKLRRDVLYSRYAEMIESIYAGQEWIHVQTSVRYQDGSEGVLKTDLRIVDSSGQGTRRVPRTNHQLRQ